MIDKSNNVEFFVQQSSFGSDSRYTDTLQDLDSSILYEIDNIFACLAKELVPYESQVNQQNISVFANRARIIYKQALPQQQLILKKSTPTPQLKKNQEIITSASNRLRNFLKDYNSYTSQVLPYKELYNKYAKNEDQDFKKKDYPEIYFDMQPDYVQIVEQKAQGGNLQASSFQPISANLGNGEQEVKIKQIVELREQINRVLRREKKSKQQYEIALSNEKMNNDIRVNRLFQLRWRDKSEMKNQQLSAISKQLTECQQRLIKQQQSNQQLRIKINNLDKKINQKNIENQKLINELESFRKLSNSRYSEQFQPIQSMKSQLDAPNSDIKKLQKINKNLINENSLLKNQLNKMRQINYAIQKRDANDLSTQLISIKKTYEKLQADYRKLQAEYDKLRIENLKLNENAKFIQRVLDDLKKQNIDIKGKMKETQDNQQFYYGKQSRYAENSNVKLTGPIIESYNGDGSECSPYYEYLSRQYKIRFRRSCLKEKQLLYKHSGLQVGVVSSLLQVNEIKIILHLTNYCQKEMKNIRLKALNPNENKISLEFSNIELLRPQEQKKLLIYCFIRCYPIGPAIILIQFQTAAGKMQEARILLPAHIFKMMEIKQRTQPIKRGKSKNFQLDSKIAKDFEGFRNLFKGIQPTGNNKLQIEAKHNHTQTIVLLDIIKIGSQIEIKYQTFDGNDKITDYFIKTLIFLLARET